jgi:NAD(P)H-dependent FMN reductase
MKTIAIISPSIRRGRKSHRVALYLESYIKENNLAKTEIIDLKEYRFPLFDERLNRQDDPMPEALLFAEKIRNADGVIIVAPEYNGGYPASLKNVIDLLYDEWKRKPVAVTTVSDGSFGGTQVVTSLQFSLWKIGALTVPAMFPVPMVADAFDELGNPADKASADKRSSRFISALIWHMEAKDLMEGHS